MLYPDRFSKVTRQMHFYFLLLVVYFWFRELARYCITNCVRDFFCVYKSDVHLLFHNLCERNVYSGRGSVILESEFNKICYP